KDESLLEFIRWFMKKKNTIPGVSDAVAMAAFRKGVKDPDLLKKISRRQPTMVKELSTWPTSTLIKKMQWSPKMVISHAKRKRRITLSPPNQKIARARAM